MKKLLLMCCFLVGITAASHAQGGRRTPEERAKQLQTQLSLTDDQTAKITAIYQAGTAKRDSIRTASNGDRDAMMKAMMPMMQAENTKVKAILTPDQATAYQKILDARMARMQGGGQ